MMRPCWRSTGIRRNIRDAIRADEVFSFNVGVHLLVMFWFPARVRKFPG